MESLNSCPRKNGERFRQNGTLDGPAGIRQPVSDSDFRRRVRTLRRLVTTGVRTPRTATPLRRRAIGDYRSGPPFRTAPFTVGPHGVGRGRFVREARIDPCPPRTEPPDCSLCSSPSPPAIPAGRRSHLPALRVPARPQPAAGPMVRPARADDACAWAEPPPHRPGWPTDDGRRRGHRNRRCCALVRRGDRC